MNRVKYKSALLLTCASLGLGNNSIVSAVFSDGRAVNIEASLSKSDNTYSSMSIDELRGVAISSKYNVFMEFDSPEDMFKGPRSVEEILEQLGESSDQVWLLKEANEAKKYGNRLNYLMTQINNFNCLLAKLSTLGYEKYTLLLGKSKVGKTVLINALQNKEFTYTTQMKALLDVNNIRLEFNESQSMLHAGTQDGIGNSRISETFFPVPYVINSTNEIFIDCPGFGDTRKRCYSIATLFFLRSLLETVNEVRFLPVASEQQLKDLERADSFKVFQEAFKALLPKQETSRIQQQLENSMFFVMTKGTRKSFGERYPKVDVKSLLPDNFMSEVSKNGRVGTLGDIGKYLETLLDRDMQEFVKPHVLSTAVGSTGTLQRSVRRRRGSRAEAHSPVNTIPAAVINAKLDSNVYAVSEISGSDFLNVKCVITPEEMEEFFSLSDLKRRILDLPYIQREELQLGWPLDEVEMAKFKEVVCKINEEVAEQEKSLLNGIIDKIHLDIPGQSPDIQKMQQVYEILISFGEILDKHKSASLKDLTSILRPLSKQYGLEKNLEVLESMQDLVALITRVVGSLPSLDSTVVRGNAIQKAEELRETLKQHIQESRQWNIMLESLEYILLSAGVQSKRQQFADKLINGYSDFLKSIANNELFSAKINNDLGVDTCLTPKETGVDIWMRLADSELYQDHRKSQFKMLVKWALEDDLALNVTKLGEKDFKDPMNPSKKTMKRKALKIVGRIIKASDILQQINKMTPGLALSNKDTTGKVYDISVYASHAFLIDQDLKLQGVNLSILSPRWRIEETRTIDLSGRNGASGPHKKPKTPQGFSQNGLDGADGKPGESSGNLMIFGLSSEEARKLKIRLDGGNGGCGQDAGSGSNGDKGSEPLSIEEKRPDELLYKEKMAGDAGGFSALEIEYYGRAGSSGKRGGKSGRPGSLGRGGKAGKVVLLPELKAIITTTFEPGKDGLPGKKAEAAGGGAMQFVIRPYFNFYQKATVLTVPFYPIFGISPAVTAIVNTVKTGWRPEVRGCSERDINLLTPFYIEQDMKMEKIAKDFKKSAEEKGWLKNAEDGDIVDSPSMPRDGILTDNVFPFKQVAQYQEFLKMHVEEFNLTQQEYDSIVGKLTQCDAYYTPATFEDVSSIIHQLTLDEMQGDSKQILSAKWHSFEKGMEEFINTLSSQEKNKANRMLQPIKHKLCAVGFLEGDADAYVWNLDGFLSFLDNKIEKLSAYKKEEYFFKRKKEYAEHVDTTIKTATADSKKLQTHLDQDIDQINNEISKIEAELKKLLDKTDKNIKKINAQITSYKILMGFKITFSVLKMTLGIASVVNPAFAPIDGILSSAMGLSTSIAEDLIKPGDPKELKFDMPMLKFKDTYGFSPQEELKTLEDKITGLTGIEDVNELRKEATKIYTEFKGKVEKLNMLDEKIFNSFNKLAGVNEPISSKELKDLKDMLETKKKELEAKVKEWEENAATGARAIQGAVGIYNACRSTLNELKKMNKTKVEFMAQLANLKSSLQQLELAQADVKNLGDGLKYEVSSFKEFTFSQLIISSTKFVNTLKLLSNQFRKMQEGLKIESAVCDAIDTTTTKFNGIINMYKQIAQYKDHKDFAGYIADLHSEEDPDILAVASGLESHYLLTQHYKILMVLRAHLIAYGSSPHTFSALLSQISDYTKNNKTFVLETYLPVFSGIISAVKDTIAKGNAFITTQDILRKPMTDFVTGGEWSYDKFPDIVTTIMRGDKTEISLEASSSSLNLFAFNNVRLRIKHVNEQLDSALTNYLSIQVEAVLAKSGSNVFRIDGSFYEIPLSPPPTLTHMMNQAGSSENVAMNKIRDKKSSPVSSPFGGTWTIRIKPKHNESIDFTSEEKMKEIFGCAYKLDAADLLKGLTVYLEFRGQCFDFSVDPVNEKKHIQHFQNLLREFCIE
jgi:sulfur relay (sulfurtransferase) DsrC/TusE family protein